MRIPPESPFPKGEIHKIFFIVGINGFNRISRGFDSLIHYFG